MDQTPPAPPAADAGKPASRKGDERLAREAAALRANLLKRKQQARGRQDQDRKPSAPAQPADPPDTQAP